MTTSTGTNATPAVIATRAARIEANRLEQRHRRVAANGGSVSTPLTRTELAAQAAARYAAAA